MRPAFDPSTVAAPRLKDAFAYWQSKQAGRAMPGRRDIDPTEMPRLLPYLLLIDVLRRPLDFRYRLVGTEVRNLSKEDYTGRRFSEVPGKGQGSVVWQNCEQVVLTKAPYSRTPPYVGPDRYVRDCESLLLPLSDDGRTVDMILKVISFTRRC